MPVVLTLTIGVLLITLNTVTGLVLVDYNIVNFIAVDINLLLSVAIIYFIVISKMVDGFKIGLTVLFLITGLGRCLCTVLASYNLSDNVFVITVIAILIFEIICTVVALLVKDNGIK
jgi:hypothetical protein